MTNTANNDLIQKIRDLRRKAENEGCTEAEAMQCAAMAARMMDKHGISETDLEVAVEDGSLSAARDYAQQKTKRVDDAVQWALSGIAKLSETRILLHSTVVHGRGTVEEKPMVVGLEADREFALYLIELTRAAATREWKAALKSGRFDSSQRKSFKIGVGYRLAERMIEIARARDAARKPATNGTSLVVLKDQLIAQELKGTAITTARRRQTSVDGGAYEAGRAAADGIGLGRPIEGGSGGATSLL